METKPAVYTTEFWVAIFGIIVNFINIAGIWDWASNWHSGILMTVIAAFYAVARGQAKSHGGFDPNNPNNYKLIPRLKTVNPRQRV